MRKSSCRGDRRETAPAAAKAWGRLCEHRPRWDGPRGPPCAPTLQLPHRSHTTAATQQRRRRYGDFAGRQAGVHPQSTACMAACRVIEFGHRVMISEVPCNAEARQMC
eukprot:354742-Chlamydomonas_euryale.AAC.2